MKEPLFRIVQIKKGSSSDLSFEWGDPCFQMVDYYFESEDAAESWIKERLDIYHKEGYRQAGRNWFIIIQDFSPATL